MKYCIYSILGISLSYLLSGIFELVTFTEDSQAFDEKPLTTEHSNYYKENNRIENIRKKETDSSLENINLVIEALNTLYPQRIENYKNLSISPITSNENNFGITDNFEVDLIMGDLRFKSFLMKWLQSDNEFIEEQFLVKDYLNSYFPSHSVKKAWCIEDACLVLAYGNKKIDFCKSTLDQFFMGYKNCLSRQASRSERSIITYYISAVFYNPIEDQVNALL